MSTPPVVNPPSFRFPFEISGKVHPEVEKAIRWAFNGLTNHEQAFAALNTKVNAATPTTSTVSTPATATTTAENVTINEPGTVTGGVVNNQTGVTSYIIQQSDNAGLVVLNDASPIALSLVTALTVPFYTTITNAGSSTATLTPTTGQVNNNATLTVPGMSFATLFLDGTNWWADEPGTSTGAVTQIIAGTGVTISPVSGVGIVTINSTGTGSNFADNETPGGTINGINVTFTLAHTPNPAGSLILASQGQVMDQNVAGDYTLSGSTITFLVAPTLGPLICWYRY